MSNYLSNAFSLQMLGSFPAVPIIEEVGADEIPEDAISVIGHPDTARVLFTLLGREIYFNRQSITLCKNDTLYVAQLMGGRLPEGATTIPEGMKIQFLKIRVLYRDYLCIHNDGRVCDSITTCHINCDLL